MIGEILLSHWQHGSRSPSGWISGNAPCCHHRGETRDTRKRGGIRIEPNGSVVYNCFNCKFTASWKPGRTISKNMNNLMKWVGVPTDTIKEVSFKMWAAASGGKSYTKDPTEFVPWMDKFVEKELPQNAKLFNAYLDNPHPKFLKVLDYFSHRDPLLITRYDFMFSPHLAYSDAFIIPFYYSKKLVGYALRNVTGKTPKYLVNKSENFLFNADILNSTRNIVIIVEGILDAINIDGISTLGSTLTSKQIAWLNNSGKEIILVPDMDAAGVNLIDVAIKQGWGVSIPMSSGPTKLWDENIKDVSDAVASYGVMYTIHSIMSSVVTNPLEIKLLTKFNIA